MARIEDMSKDVRLTQYASVTIDPNALVPLILGRSLDVKSRNTWYPVWDAKGYMRIDDSANYKIGFNSVPKECSFVFSSKEIYINGHETWAFLSRDSIREFDALSIRNAEELLTMTVEAKLNFIANMKFLTLIQDTTLWNNQAVSAVWTDQTNGDPEADLRDMRADIITASAGTRRPNTIIASRATLDYLYMHAKIKTRYDNIVGDQKAKHSYFMDLLGIAKDRVFEIDTTKNTAAKGATETPEVIMTNKLWMGYIDPAPSPLRPTAMAALVPVGESGNEKGVAMTKMKRLSGEPFEDLRFGIKILGRHYTVVKQLSKPLGKILTGIFA